MMLKMIFCYLSSLSYFWRVLSYLWEIISLLKHFDSLFYSSEEHFISDNLNKVSKCFKIVKGPPVQSLLQIISPRLRLGDIIL